MQQDKKLKTIEMYVLLATDLLSVAVSYALAYYFRFHVLNISSHETHKMVLLSLLLVGIAYSFFIDWNREFTKRGYLVELIAITKYNAILLIAASMLVYLLKQGEFFSRLVFAYFAIINELVTFLLHILIKKVLRRYLTSNHSIVKVLVVSPWEDLGSVLDRIKSKLPFNYEIAGLVISDKDLSGSVQSGVPVVSGIDNIIENTTGLPFDEVFINLPNNHSGDLRNIIKEFEAMGIVCHYSIDALAQSSTESILGQFGGYTVISYSINRMDYRRLLIKRMMDIVGAIFGLIITAIITPFVAVAIKLDSKGPVFFAQTRIGKNGRRFKMYKFRSMVTDAEVQKEKLQDSNEMNGLMFKMEDDPRITRVGRFIRKTSIDELPQFYNILRGDMSLVGTRPPTEDEFERYNAYYRRRLCMTPGLTGLWQVSGRNDISDFDEVVRLDLEYIDTWCLTNDIKIMFKTIGAVLHTKGSR